MEDCVATDKRPLDKCLADVASCDVYVGIFAWRYGYIPPGQERSITELEYRNAGLSGLERLIFLLDEDAPWPRKYMDEVTGEGKKGQKIKALRQELMAARLLQFFKSPEEMAGQVAAFVAVWAQKRLDAEMDSLRVKRDQADRERRKMRDCQRMVNLRVIGRGGMGKMALASRVLADLERGALPVPGEEKDLPIDGILYFSARSTSPRPTLGRGGPAGRVTCPSAGRIPTSAGELRRAGRRPRRAPRPEDDPRGGHRGPGTCLRAAGRLCGRRDGHWKPSSTTGAELGSPKTKPEHSAPVLSCDS
jgi:hypothetical protein